MKDGELKYCWGQKPSKERKCGVVKMETLKTYMVGASASEGVAARAASFSEAMGLELVKCDDKTLILSLLLLSLPLIHGTMVGKPKIQWVLGWIQKGLFFGAEVKIQTGLILSTLIWKGSDVISLWLVYCVCVWHGCNLCLTLAFEK